MLLGVGGETHIHSALLPPSTDPTEHVELRVVTGSGMVKEGDDVKLVCDADGNPAPVFTFYKREVRGGSGPSPSASPVPGWRG